MLSRVSRLFASILDGGIPHPFDGWKRSGNIRPHEDD
jgi:hypothetical protein